MERRPGRQRDQLPTCYYEGYLEKRSFKDKMSKKLWTSLCGKTLFFFNNMRDSNYVEKLDLSGFVSITDDNSADRNLEAARLNLQLNDGNIKLTAPNAEARELWKGYIRSVVQLSVPSSLNLLPGQIHMLNSAVDREKERIRNASPIPPAASDSSLYLSVEADMPLCFYEVSRMEAELLLEKEAQKGNLLLRPGRGGDSFAVSTRQDLDGSIFKHYRVVRKAEGGFSIDVDNPVPCATLHDVITYLVKTTDGVLIPLVIQETYEEIISFVRSDNENGEKTIQHAATNVLPPSLPSKHGAPRVPTPEPEAAACEEEGLYRNLDDEKTETETQDSSAVPLPAVETPVNRRVMLPPVPAPRKRISLPSLCSSSSSSPLSSTTKSTDPKTKGGAAESQGLAFLSELRLKLGQKVQSQE